MDLGIAGRKAIVCAASKGLGRACAMSLAREGVDLVITARTAGPLEATAEEIRSATGVLVRTVASDITTEEGRAAVLAACPDPERWPALRHELTAQLGEGLTLARLGEALPAERLPFAGRRRATRLRCLRQLQDRWQQQLEAERRRRLQPLVQRSQWLVAAAVLGSPLPSADLLLMTVVNGLLLREMAELWPCRWTADQLRSAALELGRVALALGTVEWGTQALGAALKLHGATWLVGGTLQALSAAYLTRVLARSMADALALASGVPEEELPALPSRFPQLVSRALEQERLDWQGFVDQAFAWGQRQTATATT